MKGRERVLNDVLLNAPTTITGVARRIGLTRQSAQYHARRLVQSEELRFVDHGARTYLMPAPRDPQWRVHLALRDQPMRELALALLQPRRACEVVDAFRLEGWPRATTQDRIQRLVTAGAATRREQDNSVFVHASPEAIRVLEASDEG